MPISLLLVYGAMGGLSSVLIAALMRPLLPRSICPPPVADRITVREIVEASLHLAGGAAVAALYWLSWGFAALVAVPWWMRGLAFGAACWLAVAVPALAALWLRAGVAGAKVAVVAAEWAATSVLAALACAWIWGTTP